MHFNQGGHYERTLDRLYDCGTHRGGHAGLGAAADRGRLQPPDALRSVWRRVPLHDRLELAYRVTERLLAASAFLIQFAHFDELTQYRLASPVSDGAEWRARLEQVRRERGPGR